MDPGISPDRSELNILPEEEVERLELLEVASAVLIEHAETLAKLELDSGGRRAA